MKIISLIFIFSYVIAQSSFADEVLCEKISSELAKIERTKDGDFVALDVFFPKKVGDLSFQSVKMKIFTQKKKCKSCKTSSLEVVVNAEEKNNQMMTSLDLQAFDGGSIELTASYVGVCISQLQLKFNKADLMK